MLSSMAARPSAFYATAACRVDSGASAAVAAVGFCNGRREWAANSVAHSKSPRSSGFGGPACTSNLLLSSSWNGGALIHSRLLRIGPVENLARDKRWRGRCSLNGGLGIRSENASPGPNVAAGTENNKGSISRLELSKSGESLKRKPSYNGIFLILLLNLGIFVGDQWLGIAPLRKLYLYHDVPQWYQFITSTFCHLSWNHLSSNLFFLYIFGKLVEEEGGGFAVWLSYLITGVGANMVSWLILPRTVVSAGASGAVFGLFAISVLVKLSFDWRKILEVLILGQFVVEKVMEAAHASAQLGGHVYNSSNNINHIAHLSGALVGVALIWVLRKLPSGETKQK